MRKQLDRKKLVAGTDTASVGIEMSLAIAGGFLLGRWIDGELGSGPWMMLLCAAIGMGAAIKALVRVHKRQKTDGARRRARGEQAVPWVPSRGEARWTRREVAR